MKSELTFKYIQYIRSRKNREEGFTLIELLVVVIIIGVLAAVALPNLLGQIGKARETEIKNAVGTVMRSQQAYHFERQAFAPSVTNLGITIPSEYLTNATSMIVLLNTNDSLILSQNTNALNDGTRAYSAKIIYQAGQFDQIMCQTNDIAVEVNPFFVPNGTLNNLLCGTGSTKIR